MSSTVSNSRIHFQKDGFTYSYGIISLHAAL